MLAGAGGCGRLFWETLRRKNHLWGVFPKNPTAGADGTCFPETLLWWNARLVEFAKIRARIGGKKASYDPCDVHAWRGSRGSSRRRDGRGSGGEDGTPRLGGHTRSRQTPQTRQTLGHTYSFDAVCAQRTPAAPPVGGRHWEPGLRAPSTAQGHVTIPAPKRGAASDRPPQDGCA